MFSILMVLMSIALFAVFVYGGINYLNIENFKIAEKKNIIETGLVTLETNFSIYKNQKDYYLPTTDWEIELSSMGKSIPDLETGYSWSYNKVNNKYYFCISSNTTSERYYFAMKSISEDRSKAYININCGSDDSTPVMSTPATFPTTISLTYWIN